MSPFLLRDFVMALDVADCGVDEAGVLGVGSRDNLLRWSVGCAIGGGVPLIGFTPFNHASDVLSLDEHPWRVIALPPTILVAFAVAAAFVLPQAEPRRMPRWLVLGWGMLVLGALVSLTASGNRTETLLLTILAAVYPGILVWALARTRVPPESLGMGFLVVSSLLLVRAAAVFARDYGFPVPADMFVAKFTSTPFDFHYYGLQNPTQTSLWVLLPMTLGCYWAARPGSSTTGRAVAGICGAACFFSMILLYGRHTIILSTIVVAVAFAVGRLPWFWRAVGVTATIGVSALALFGTGDARTYAASISQLKRTQAIERNAQAIERNAQAIERNAQADASGAQAGASGAQAGASGAQADDVLRAQADVLRAQADALRAQADALRAQADESRAQADEPSASVRLRSMSEGFEAFAKHPVAGVGLGQYHGPNGDLPAHSSVPQGAAELGVLGLGAVVILTTGLLLFAYRRVRASRPGGLATAAALAAAVFALDLVVGGGANIGLSNGYVTVWGMSAALMIAVALDGRLGPQE